MILFCEDCGNKNVIGPDQVTDHKAVFRCSVCNYLNSVSTGRKTVAQTAKTTTHPSANDCDRLVQTLKKVPGLSGFFLFHTKTGVLQNHMPGVLLHQDLEIIGKILISNIKICSFQYPDITRQFLVIEGKNLVLQMINKTCGLIVACHTFPLTALQEKTMDHVARAHWSLEA